MTHRPQFPLFQTPLDLAHAYWKKHLKPGDTAIDATCGNGYDTLFLAKSILSSDHGGQVIAIDSQEEAINNTKLHIKAELPPQLHDKVHFYHQCHSSFPHVAPASVALIVYNLGYLPKGNKSITTMCNTTLQSLNNAMLLIAPGGLISITCYPGHDEGKIEEEALLKFTADLSPQQWSCCHHRWTNRREAPSLILLQKAS